MTRYPSVIALVGIGFLAAGAVTAGVPFAAGSGAAVAPASVGVTVAAGASLVGRPTPLSLRLTAGAGATLAVTDLVSAGLTYVPGSSTLGAAGGTGGKGVADPAVVATAKGTLLVWSSLTLPAGDPAAWLSLDVRPLDVRPAAGTTGSIGTAGWRWTDEATVYAARSGSAAPSLSPAGGPLSPAADLVAVARRGVRVVALSASETGRLLPTAGVAGVQHLAEHLTVEAGKPASVKHTTIRVYLPGTATWLRCAGHTSCRPPAVTHVELAVGAAGPDRPKLRRAAATGALPAGSSAAPSTGAATADLAPFTVLTWALGSIPAGANLTLDYRVAAAPIASPRTSDVVTASGTTGTGTTALTQAISVQPWPASAAKVTTKPAGARGGAGPKVGSEGLRSSAAATTSTTTPVDPFGSTTTTTTKSTSSTTTRSGRTTTTTRSKSHATTTTTTGKGSLATTGTDLGGMLTVGLALGGGGVVLLVVSRRRRPGPGSGA